MLNYRISEIVADGNTVTNHHFYGRLAELGQHVGHRMVDVLCWRERATKRETRLVNMLLFIKNNVWKVKGVTAYIVTDDEILYRHYSVKKQIA